MTVLTGTTADAVDAPRDAVTIIDEIHQLTTELQQAKLSELPDAQVEYVTAETERVRARLASAGNQQLVEVEVRDLPRKTGKRSILQYMQDTLRMTHPGRRRSQVKATATFTDLSGQPLEPELPALAEAFAEGRVGPVHVHAVMDVMDQIPNAVEHDVKVAAERTMAEYASWMTPAEIDRIGAQLLAHLDPDGTLTDTEDRKRRRRVQINRQRADGMSKLIGNLTPELRALLATFLDVWAKPGMNNPNDPDSPRGSIEDADSDQVAAAAERDFRTPAQMQHDALTALLKAVFEDGLLGKTHRGLPMNLIAKAELNDLIREAGFAVTADGTLIPIKDLIKMGGEVQPWLAVFEDGTAVPLYFGRGKRLASMEQRLVSFARPGGETCSTPDCDVVASRLEMHHAEVDWVDGGFTDIDNLIQACTRHHHMVGDQPGRFTTHMIDTGPDAGRCSWQLNVEPGAPPNPARVNRKPDIGRRLNEILTEVRAEIHGPSHPERLSGSPPRPDWNSYTSLREVSPLDLARFAEAFNAASPN